ncbi:MAG: AMP nucleosidase, partial [Epibacterium sp.]|nr:AMP nucleosidase [Epibacterium sp.]NQX75088.1 AMP nucleosidase [Epibacterium sp.]
MTDIQTPDLPKAEVFTDAKAAVARLLELYNGATNFLCDAFVTAIGEGEAPAKRIRAFYPEVRFTTNTYAQVDSRLSYGHVADPGTYSTTITRPDLFKDYLIGQIALLMKNHDQPVEIGPSQTPMPVHFAVASRPGLTVPQ